MTWQLSSAEWIQEQQAFVLGCQRRPGSLLRVKRVTTGTDPVTTTISARPIGPGACTVCGCDRLLFDPHYGVAHCKRCGHGSEFHVVIGALTARRV
jgi:hypothetical protein